MKTIVITDKDKKTEYIIISHKFKGLKNIIVSGGKIYQLPCQVGKKSFKLKEIVKKRYYYWIESKAYSEKKLKELIYKRKDKIILREEYFYPWEI